MKRFPDCLVLAMVVFGCVACASSPRRESIGEYLDNSIVTTKVKSLLATDHFLKSLQIGVETFRNTVILSGFVDSKKDADRAVEIAGSVQGVESIANGLIVKRVNRSRLHCCRGGGTSTP